MIGFILGAVAGIAILVVLIYLILASGQWGPRF